MIYIAGPITGVFGYEENFNHAESMLRNKYGDCVINPCKLSKTFPNYPNLKHEHYMAVDMAALSLCDTIYMLHGWYDSKCATTEYNYAYINGLKILFEDIETKGASAMMQYWNKNEKTVYIETKSGKKRHTVKIVYSCPDCGKKTVVQTNYCAHCGIRVHKEIPQDKTPMKPEEIEALFNKVNNMIRKLDAASMLGSPIIHYDIDFIDKI